MSDTLLLNADYKPISVLPLSVITWQHSIKLMFLGKVQVLETYNDWLLHSEKLTINVPSVCVTREYFRYSKAVKYSRHNLYLRDLYQCQYCYEIFDYEDLTIDHVIPASAGGKSDWNNTVTSCYACNQRKGSRFQKPRTAPYKPDYYELVKKWRNTEFTVRDAAWNKYLGVDKPILHRV